MVNYLLFSFSLIINLNKQRGKMAPWLIFLFSDDVVVSALINLRRIKTKARILLRWKSRGILKSKLLLLICSSV